MDIDKQINNRVAETTDYWVKDFFALEVTTTSIIRAQRQAFAPCDANQKVNDLKVKKENSTAVTLAAGIDDQPKNTEKFCEH
ncbi:MAG: hypothetical protein GY789_10225 [Hyphomicrobiales bacterium]|nr:hypothetical protein [Hyphomicrobiales bacterium]